MIREWLETNKNDDNRLKASITYQGLANDSPLHFLLCTCPPLDIIQTIIKYAPEVLIMKNNFGWLPIHYACLRGASLEVIQALLTASPDTIKVRDNYGWLPLHLACQNDASLNVLNFLIESYPQGIDHKNKVGRTPLDFLKQIMYAEKMTVECFCCIMPATMDPLYISFIFLFKHIQKAPLFKIMMGTPLCNILLKQRLA